MRIRFLGTHDEESDTTRLVSLIIDEVLAVDAGSLSSELSFAEQAKVKAILLSHGHYDHIRAVPAFGFNNSERITSVFATQNTLDILTSHLLDGLIYPKLTEKDSFLGKSALALYRLEVFSPVEVEGHQVTPLPLNHPVEAVGFVISSRSQDREKSILYATDTGPGLSELWAHASPQLLIVDGTYPNRLEKMAWEAGHLCPKLLVKELLDFKRTKGYLPKVALTHRNPRFEDEIGVEAQRASEELGISIELANEGDTIDL